MEPKLTTTINVTKSFLPPREEFDRLVDEIWTNGQLTNNGALSKRFEKEVCGFLGVDDKKFTFVANGTLSLQLAIRGLLGDGGGEIITTPFTYVATTSAILWEGFQPVYVDIDPETLNIDPDKIESAITKNTRAILAVHVFGNPCNVEKIQKIAKKHNLKVIYDAAHAFGVRYQGKSLLEYGDASILSFHATKLFHTIEGGSIYVGDDKLAEKIELLKRFGHDKDDYVQLGINAKASEFQAAMGLANLTHIDDIIESRKRATKLYDSLLEGAVERPVMTDDTDYNFAYYPVLLRDEDRLHEVENKLAKKQIYPRRYFYPSLNMLHYINETYSCPVSEDVASRILCLPLYHGMDESVIKEISKTVKA